MEKKKVMTIDCTPTWEGVLPLLLEGLKSDSNEVYSNNMEELRRMAQLADAYNELIKSKQNAGLSGM